MNEEVAPIMSRGVFFSTRHVLACICDKYEGRGNKADANVCMWQEWSGCLVNGLIVGADILSIRFIICIDNGKDDFPQLDVIIIWISALSRQQPDIRDPPRYRAELMITLINGGDHHYHIGILYHDHHVVNADEDDGDAGDGDGSASVEIDVWLIRRDRLLSCHTFVLSLRLSC